MLREWEDGKEDVKNQINQLEETREGYMSSPKMEGRQKDQRKLSWWSQKQMGWGEHGSLCLANTTHLARSSFYTLYGALGKTKFSFIKAPFRLGMATGTKTQQNAWVLGTSNLRLAPVAMNIVIFIELHNCSKHPHPQNGYNGNTYYERTVLRIKWDHIWLRVSILLSKILIICPIVMWNYLWKIYKDDKGKGDLYMIIIK